MSKAFWEATAIGGGEMNTKSVSVGHKEATDKDHSKHIARRLGKGNPPIKGKGEAQGKEKENNKVEQERTGAARSR